MIVIISVVVGYILGILPFFILKKIDKQEKKEIVKQEKEIKTEASEILTEYLYGNKKENNAKQKEKIKKNSILNEYLNGKEKDGE